MRPCVFLGHGEVGEFALGCPFTAHAGESLRGEFAAVRAAENPAAWCEAGVGEGNEAVVVFFDSEDLAFVVAGEGGRIEDDAIECATLTGEAFEPVEGIAFAEVVVVGVEIVGLKVLTCPVEVNLGEVKGGGGGSRKGGANGEGSCVGEGVEDGFSWG